MDYNYRILATSGCGLDYYEKPHENIDILDCEIIIATEGNSCPERYKDIEEICAVRLQTRYEAGQCNIQCIPPHTDDILRYLKNQLTDNNHLFIVSPPHEEAQQNFSDAIARLPQIMKDRVTLYRSISAGFCNSIVTLAANKLLQLGYSFEEASNRLNTLEKRSMLLYTSLNLESAPDNEFVDILRGKPYSKITGYPIAQMLGYSEDSGFNMRKIAEVADIESIVEQFRKEIVSYAQGETIDAFISCPTNHPNSRYFCESLSEQLNCEKNLVSMPIMPEHLVLIGAECFAVRVYHPADHDLVNDLLTIPELNQL